MLWTNATFVTHTKIWPMLLKNPRIHITHASHTTHAIHTIYQIPFEIVTDIFLNVSVT